MKKEHKSLSTNKSPNPLDDHSIIEDWRINNTMPRIQPIVKEIDILINKLVLNLQYAIKRGNAYYGSKKNGWFIEVASYKVSVNIVFLMELSLIRHFFFEREMTLDI